MFDPNRFSHPDNFEAFQEEWEEQRRLNSEMMEEFHAEYNEWLRMVDMLTPPELPKDDIILPIPAYVMDRAGTKKDSGGTTMSDYEDDIDYELMDDDDYLDWHSQEAGFPNCVHCGPECLFWGGDGICYLGIQAMAEEYKVEEEARYRLTVIGWIHLGIRDLVRGIANRIQNIMHEPTSEEEIPF